MWDANYQYQPGENRASLDQRRTAYEEAHIVFLASPGGGRHFRHRSGWPIHASEFRRSYPHLSADLPGALNFNCSRGGNVLLREPRHAGAAR